MTNAFARVSALVFIYLVCVPSWASSASLTLTIGSKNKVGGQYKVVVNGVISINKGETFSGLANAGILDITACPNVFYGGTWVSITPPVMNCCGTWKNGSFQFFALSSVNDNYGAGCSLMYVNNLGQPKSTPGKVNFALP